MQIFNIGPLELILILVLALIVLGPENMVKTARDIGRTINRFIRSPLWATLMSTSREIRELPTKIVRDTGLEESLQQIREETQAVTKELNQELGESVNSLNNAVQQINAETTVNTNSLGTLLPPSQPQDEPQPITELPADPLPVEESHPVRTAFEAAGLSGDDLNVLPEDEPIQSAWQAAGLFEGEETSSPTAAAPEPGLITFAPPSNGQPGMAGDSAAHTVSAAAAAGIEPSQPEASSLSSVAAAGVEIFPTPANETEPSTPENGKDSANAAQQEQDQTAEATQS